ncbi:MAG: hypothetical protein ABJB78_01845 [Betaproteobacteria bacterium]
MPRDAILGRRPDPLRVRHNCRIQGPIMNKQQLVELLLQSLEHEKVGVEVYENALQCAVLPDLQEEWGKYLDQTKTRVQILEQVCDQFGLDTTRQSPGRDVVRSIGRTLVDAMQRAPAAGDPEAAQLVACECVVIAETKDHLDWELLGKCARKLTGEEGRVLLAATEQVEDEEDEPLCHSKGWCRELWLKSRGLRAVPPPPEEQLDVKTAVGAARAEQAAHKAR